MDKVLKGQTVKFKYRVKIKDGEGCGKHISEKSQAEYEIYSPDIGCGKRPFKFPNADYCVPCLDKVIPTLQQGDCIDKIKYAGTISKKEICANDKNSKIKSVDYKWTFYADGTEIKTLGNFDLDKQSGKLKGELEIPAKYAKKGVKIKAVLTGKANMMNGGCVTGEVSKEFTISDTSSDPILVCKGEKEVEGCNTDVLGTTSELGNLAYSETKKTITEEKFKSVVKSIKNTCFVGKYEYKDTKSGECPIVVTRKFIVTDKGGKEVSCEQTIKIKKTDFTLPADGSSSVDCADKAVKPTPPTVNDACGDKIKPVLKTTPPAASCGGTMVWVFTYEDCAKHSHDWKYTYTIDDKIKPTIKCPADQTKIIAQGQTEYTVSGKEFDIKSKDVSDNCTATDKLVFTNNLNNKSSLEGYKFPKGETEVKWTVKDACNNTSECTFKVKVVSPKISLVKKADYKGDSKRAKVGDKIEYTFTVTNEGNVKVTKLKLNDAKLKLKDISFTPSDLAPKAKATYKTTYTVTSKDIEAGVVTNTALAEGKDPKGNIVSDTSGTDTDNDTPTEVPLTKVPKISLKKEADYKGDAKRAKVGDKIEYTFTVKNEGNVKVTKLKLNDAKLKLKDVSFTPSELAPGKSTTYTATYTVTTADIEAGVVSNTAVADGKDPDGKTVSDTSGTDTDNDTPTEVPLTKLPKISLVKKADYKGN